MDDVVINPVDIQIQRLDTIGDPDIQGLSDVLIDCVEGGASVSFMFPMSREKAERFWHTVSVSVNRGERILLIAQDNSEKIIGTVQIILNQPENQPHRADIAKMLVHRRSRRQGIGAALLAAAEQSALSAGKTLNCSSSTVHRQRRRRAIIFKPGVATLRRNPQLRPLARRPPLRHNDFLQIATQLNRPPKNFTAAGRAVRFHTRGAQIMSEPQSTPETPPASPPLRSVHTSSFAQILDHFGMSLAVTTYQAGKLVLLRPERRDATPVINTHFRDFRKPMGFAWERGRFALGAASEVWEFHDIPAVARKLEKSESSMTCDAVFLPRSCDFTGDVQIHEMAWLPQPGSSALSELWFINTRFSCLATRSNQYSFIPRWQPPFVTALAPEDRCHLNGMCLRDNEIRYVTALGESDSSAGWRENKRAGGILIDVKSNQIITRGLSMPHSPRFHNGKLWLLESGNGGVGVVDQTTGKYQEICRLPGFTRGLDFAGPYAFVGLSQVRETAVFSGIAIAETPQAERNCGVWAIDTRTAQIVGFVKFTDAVQEIFAVQALTGLRWPEVLTDDQKRIAETYELPDEALRKVPPQMRQLAGKPSLDAGPSSS